MLSLALPLLVLAIALTPVIVSARMLYKRDLAAHACEPATGESCAATTTQSRQASIPVKTTV